MKSRRCCLCLVAFGLLVVLLPCRGWGATHPYQQVIAETLPKMVKIYGAGGPRQLESYQSGFFVSDHGEIATVWSYVLDTDHLTVVTSDGHRYEAKIAGAIPELELALLKIEADATPHFSLDSATTAAAGDRVLAVSNLFGVASGDEPNSVQHGVISVASRLDSRHGLVESPYHGPILLLDAMTNNPGAAGGVIVGRQGELLGMLGKELRSGITGNWINYALPVTELAKPLADLQAGRAYSAPPLAADATTAIDLAAYGIRLVPEILEQTPPYVDQIVANSAAQRIGLQMDDLIVVFAGQVVRSCQALREAALHVDPDRPLSLIVMRQQKLVTFELPSPHTLKEEK